MKVLVTGATGFLGSWVVRKLVESGHSARVLVRKSSKLDNIGELFGASVDKAYGDVLDGDSVRAALDGCQAVIHTAGVPHFNPDNPELMYRVNATGAGIVMEAALAAKVDRAVLTSSVAAMGGSAQERVADESTPSNADDIGLDYSRSKLHGEREAQKVAQRGLSLVTLRPVVILGPGDIYQSSTSTILAFVRGKMPVYVEGRPSFGDVREMAAAHVAALTKGRPGETYILGGNNVTLTQLLAAIREVTGVSPPPQAPYPLAYAVAGLLEWSAKLRHQHSSLSRQLAKAGHMCTWVSSEKAKRELGYSIRPLDESLRDTIRFALSTGRLKPSTDKLRQLVP
ncbi:MAG: NAD-dependent epimerase/dehydratase family protein [Polyangia bacterium]|jgi:dihydroflavonol-4-reductase